MSGGECDGRRVIYLKPHEIHEFSGNPRKLKNPKFDEIYQSILAVGLEQPLVVTQRPGAEGYTLHSGGNTRLQAIKKIWHETRDERFAVIPCFFRPWKSEQEVLVSHFLENEVRGSTTYLERTQVIVKLIDNYLYESDQLSLREMADRLKADGVSTSATALWHMLECYKYILPALPTTLLQGLVRAQVVRLLGLKSDLSQLWLKYANSEDGFLDFWMMSLAAHDMGVEAFNFDSIRKDMISDVAGMLGICPQEINLNFTITEKEDEKNNQEVIECKSKVLSQKLEPRIRLFDLSRQLGGKHGVTGIHKTDTGIGVRLNSEELQTGSEKGELLSQIFAHAMDKKIHAAAFVQLVLGPEEVRLDDSDVKKLFEVFFLLRQVSGETEV